MPSRLTGPIMMQNDRNVRFLQPKAVQTLLFCTKINLLMIRIPILFMAYTSILYLAVEDSASVSSECYCLQEQHELADTLTARSPFVRTEEGGRLAFDVPTYADVDSGYLHTLGFGAYSYKEPVCRQYRLDRFLLLRTQIEL